MSDWEAPDDDYYTETSQPGEDMWEGTDAAAPDPAEKQRQWDQAAADAEPPTPLFIDVATLLGAGIPPPPKPVLLTRNDGHALFYAGKVNVLFGDPECGKTWIALAAVVEALNGGRRAAVIDLDHNGAGEILSRLILLGATAEQLSNPDLFRLAEPEDRDELILVVAALRMFRPAVAVVDSLGELLPMLGLSSNSPDDYTDAHRRVLTPLARAGAAVIAIDHLPKSDDARTQGQTGTVAKKRAVNGVNLRVTLHDAFVPGRGGSADMTIAKDRPGGVRAHCPVSGKNQPAGRFVMATNADDTRWWVTTPPASYAASDDGDRLEGGLMDATIKDILSKLDAAGVPATYGRDRLKGEGHKLGLNYGTKTWEEVAKRRKTKAT